MKLLRLIPLVLLLSACTPQVITVKVPVVQPWPDPPVVIRPKLAIDNLDDNSIKYDELNKTLQVTIEQLKAYAISLENYLDVYRHQPDSPPVSVESK
ncbi:hypothetical protein [Ralstonia phage RP13]|nr:hypothetical protein [Ralstonia phage RP13]